MNSISIGVSFGPRHGSSSLDTPKHPKLCHYVCHHNSYYICTPIIRPFLKYDINEQFFEKGEDAISHLSNYEKVCDEQKPHGIDGDQFKLEFFDFSLRWKAKKWFHSLPLDKKNTWANCKNSFMTEFHYDKIDFDSCNTLEVINYL